MSDSQAVAVEDPRQLEKVIMHLVTDLPTLSDEPTSDKSLTPRFAIIPPKRERILSAIEKIYTVIKAIPKPPSRDHVMPEATVADGFELAGALLPLPFDDAYLATDGTVAAGPLASDFELPNSLVNTKPGACSEMMPNEQANFQMYPDYTEFQEEMLVIPGTSKDGMALTNYFEPEAQGTSTNNEGIAYEMDATEQMIGRNSPSLEMFFDEAGKSLRLLKMIY